jgi:hypothetical protein
MLRAAVSPEFTAVLFGQSSGTECNRQPSRGWDSVTGNKQAYEEMDPSVNHAERPPLLSFAGEGTFAMGLVRDTSNGRLPELTL